MEEDVISRPPTDNDRVTANEENKNCENGRESEEQNNDLEEDVNIDEEDASCENTLGERRGRAKRITRAESGIAFKGFV